MLGRLGACDGERNIIFISFLLKMIVGVKFSNGYFIFKELVQMLSYNVKLKRKFFRTILNYF